MLDAPPVALAALAVFHGLVGLGAQACSCEGTPEPPQSSRHPANRSAPPIRSATQLCASIGRSGMPMWQLGPRSRLSSRSPPRRTSECATRLKPLSFCWLALIGSAFGSRHASCWSPQHPPWRRQRAGDCAAERIHAQLPPAPLGSACGPRTLPLPVFASYLSLLPLASVRCSCGSDGMLAPHLPRWLRSRPKLPPSPRCRGDSTALERSFARRAARIRGTAHWIPLHGPALGRARSSRRPP